MVGIGFPLDRIPQMVRDEFQEQAFRRRPRKGTAGRDRALSFEIGEIGRQSAHGVVAHALAGEMLERRHIVVGQKLGELIAPIEW